MSYSYCCNNFVTYEAFTLTHYRVTYNSGKATVGRENIYILEWILSL